MGRGAGNYKIIDSSIVLGTGNYKTIDSGIVERER